MLIDNTSETPFVLEGGFRSLRLLTSCFHTPQLVVSDDPHLIIDTSLKETENEARTRPPLPIHKGKLQEEYLDTAPVLPNEEV